MFAGANAFDDCMKMELIMLYKNVAIKGKWNIEFAIKNREIFILQSRPITTL